MKAFQLAVIVWFTPGVVSCLAYFLACLIYLHKPKKESVSVLLFLTPFVAAVAVTTQIEKAISKLKNRVK